MNKLLLYILLVVVVTIPGALLAAVLIETDEDQLDAIIGQLEDERFDGLLATANYSDGGLEISAGSDLHRFDESQRDEALELLDDATGISSAGSIQLRQQQVDVRDEEATAILNIEVDEGSYVALRLNLSLQQGQWRLERIRVMG